MMLPLADTRKRQQTPKLKKKEIKSGQTICPGLVVMGGVSHSKGRGFKSQHRILDGHFFTYICCEKFKFCLKRPKINKKEAGVGPFKKTNMLSLAKIAKNKFCTKYKQ